MCAQNISGIILNFISKYDKTSNSGQIDSMLEYTMLGEYLSGNQCIEQTFYNELSEKDKNILQKLYSKLKEKFEGLFKNAIPDITFENVTEYTDLYTKMQNTYMDYDGNIPENKKFEFQKLQEALLQFIVANGEDISQFDDINNIDFTYVVKCIIEREKIDTENKERGEKTLKLINNPFDNNILKSKTEEYIAQNNVPSLDHTKYSTDIGNGEFDKTATQQTNVCWALASINSLLTTEEGKKLLESNSYYDKNTGVFAIHLQEAENNGLHDGIYIITPEDIASDAGELAEGEGDITAYLIAVKRYFEEVRQNPELNSKMENDSHTNRGMEEGNYGFRFFEILTGGEFSSYQCTDRIFYNTKTQNGIGHGAPDGIKYDEISSIVNSKEGCVVLGLGNHSISVVGERDGKLLVQESNNSADFVKDFAYDDKREHMVMVHAGELNGAPVYEITQYDFEHYVEAVSYLKWNE